MLIATFGPTTGWVGKTITYQDDVFVLQDHGPVSAGDVMHYDDQGHLVWPSEEMRVWVESRAQGPVARGEIAASPEPESEAHQSPQEPVPASIGESKGEACSACGGPLLAEFRFCPFCGREVRASVAASPAVGGATPPERESDHAGSGFTVVVENATPGQGITIEFPPTTAQSFEFALAEAQKLPGFHQVGGDKKALYRVTIDPRETESTLSLVEQMKGWRRRSVYVDGEKVPWDAVFGFLSCHERRRGSYRPDHYCFGYENEWEFNLWGCLKAGMPFTDHAHWFTWGRWLTKKGDWEFDKDRIRHELEKTLYRVRFCPAMQDSLAIAVLDALPDTVNPNRNHNWKFVQSWDKNAQGLRIVIRDHGFKQTVVMKGAAPNGRGAIEEIMMRLRAQGHHLPPVR